MTDQVMDRIELLCACGAASHFFRGKLSTFMGGEIPLSGWEWRPGQRDLCPECRSKQGLS